MSALTELLGYTEQATAEMAAAESLAELERVRIAYLGKEGKIALALRGIGKLCAEDRPKAGQAANQARQQVEAALNARREVLEAAAAEQAAAADQLDVTLPGRGVEMGRQHPLISTLYRLCEIFTGMGYEVVTGPEVEWFDLNFTALNYPPDHPAMDDQDTFYVNDDIVLRTQTSPVQVRAMRARHAADCPVRGLDPRVPPLEVLSHCRCTPRPTHVVAPGRTFRRESVTPTHNDIFHQLECLLVAPGVSFADLKGTVTEFARECFGPETRTRFRPDFFPFTEPSADFSVSCELCGGQGCRFCKDSGWVEIGGSGLVHPNVLRAGGYDPDKASGFAFGFGIERIAQRRHRIEQIRTLYENEMRFLRQF